MSGVWDDRKKALEEEYFRRKEQEALETMRAKLSAEKESRDRAAQSLQCPRCDGTLIETTHEDVKVDHCDKCQGVWFDAGEFDRLTKREEGDWLSRLRQSFSGK